MSLQAIFVVTLILPLALGGTIPWTTPPMLVCYALSPVAFSCFLYCDSQATLRRRLLPLEELLHNRQFALLGTMSAFVYVIMATSLFYSPMLLEITYGLSPIQAGLLIIPSLIAGTITNVAVTRIHNKTGQYVPSCLVLSLLGIIGSMSMYWLTTGSSLGQLIFVTCVVGMSSGGMATVAEAHLVQFTVRERLGMSVSFTTLCMVLGSAVGLSGGGNLISTLLERNVMEVIKAAGIDPDSLPKGSLDMSKVLSALRQGKLGSYTVLAQDAYLRAFSSITLVWAASSLAIFILLAVSSMSVSNDSIRVVNEDEFVDMKLKVSDVQDPDYRRSLPGYSYF